jgi:hypothetical protein
VAHDAPPGPRQLSVPAHHEIHPPASALAKMAPAPGGQAANVSLGSLSQEGARESVVALPDPPATRRAVARGAACPRPGPAGDKVASRVRLMPRPPAYGVIVTVILCWGIQGPIRLAPPPALLTPPPHLSGARARGARRPTRPCLSPASWYRVLALGARGANRLALLHPLRKCLPVGCALPRPSCTQLEGKVRPRATVVVNGINIVVLIRPVGSRGTARAHAVVRAGRLGVVDVRHRAGRWARRADGRAAGGRAGAQEGRE